MQAIWKYQLEIAAEFRLQMPIGAKILCVQVQDEVPCLWAVVNKGVGIESRGFSWYGTGHEHTTILREYIGTIQLGLLVFHLFEN